MPNILTLQQAQNKFNAELTIDIIKNLCIELKIISSGGKTFVWKSEPKTELKELISPYGDNTINTSTFIYHPLNRNHLKYSYYDTVMIYGPTSQAEKVFKISKLKAFI